MSSCRKIDNRKKDILILGKGPTQGLEHTLCAEKIYSTNFTGNNNKFCLSLHYNSANRYLFVNGIGIYKLKAKDSKIVATPFYLGNVSKDFSVDNMKNTGFMYTFMILVLTDVITVDDILDIHNYLMKKNNMIQKCLAFLKKVFLQD